jgi:DNA-binding NtrC family response regulator/Flp pilus assembly protein TadD
MVLAAQLIQQIEDPALDYVGRGRVRCRLAKELEDSGNYQAAREAIGPLWQRIGERPRLEELDRHTAAELLLRVGSLSGWIGSANQIEGAQEIAKDFISESITIFKALGQRQKIAEAHIDLAICYWREGAFDEARINLGEVLTQYADAGSEQRARALLNSAIVEISEMRFNDAHRLFIEAAPLFERSENHSAKGRFHVNYAALLKKLGATEEREDYIDKALIEYTAAGYHFEQAGHLPYRAAVENNLGYLFFVRGRIAEAHEHLDRARRLFASLKDVAHTAQVDETRARVLLAEGRSASAEQVARAAVRTLERGDESSLLAEALTTHGVALARLGRFSEAKVQFERACDVAERAGDNESAGVAAIAALEELADGLQVDEVRALYGRADSLLAESQNTETLERLRACARLAVEAGRALQAKESTSAQDFVYADKRTGELLRTAHLVAGTQSTVLIAGETGAGKEVLARLIHQWSGRAGEFVAINCAALDETLFESLLFGDVQESLRGAVREAEGGTLFLDKIAELSFGSQGKLLRLIERGEIHPVGAALPERVDVRVVAAADCDLERSVGRGEFRADLFYRLNTFHLIIPALRERPDDIPPLAARFIAELMKVHSKQVVFPPETLEAMRKLPLTGNARELRALIERTLLTAEDGAVITPSAVETLAARRLLTAATLADPWEGCSLKDEVREFEANLIRLALATSKGRVTQAAHLLGVSHQRLCAMLQGRHKILLSAKKSSAPRKRSIISKLAR